MFLHSSDSSAQRRKKGEGVCEEQQGKLYQVHKENWANGSTKKCLNAVDSSGLRGFFCTLTSPGNAWLGLCGLLCPFNVM